MTYGRVTANVPNEPRASADMIAQDDERAGSI
jgi:hypothetical protein